jgi:phosphatidylglycerol:prolipoprotein diacylglycerol transferase
LLDGLAAAAPPGLFLGRIGNFINAELYGRVTDVPWAMRFPIRDQTGAVVGFTEPRHPSQLYQGVTEGLMAWLLVWYLAPRIRRRGVLFSVGIGWYAVARFFVEFFREKDAQMNYLFGWMTMGQFLCLLMLVGAVVCGLWFQRHGALMVSSESAVVSPEEVLPSKGDGPAS